MIPEKIADRLRRRLELLYGSQSAPDVLSRIEGLLKGYEGSFPEGKRRGWDQSWVARTQFLSVLM